MHLESLLCKKKDKSIYAEMCLSCLGPSSSLMIQDSGNVRCSQRSPCLCMFLGKLLGPKDDRDQPEFHQWQVQKQTSVTHRMGCISANGMGG